MHVPVASSMTRLGHLLHCWSRQEFWKTEQIYESLHKGNTATKVWASAHHLHLTRSSDFYALPPSPCSLSVRPPRWPALRERRPPHRPRAQQNPQGPPGTVTRSAGARSSHCHIAGQDFINRYQMLQGKAVKYVPGWDCHGLPIELKVLASLPRPAVLALTHAIGRCCNP